MNHWANFRQTWYVIQEGGGGNLIDYCFTSRSRIFHLFGDVIFTDEGLQNLGLCLVLRAFEQQGIFIVLYLQWHGASVFPVSPGSMLLRWATWPIVLFFYSSNKLCREHLPSVESFLSLFVMKSLTNYWYFSIFQTHYGPLLFFKW
jgi:hypothetical protein